MTRVTFFAFFILLQTLGQEVKFENFSVNNGLSNNSVKDIENDNNGGLWVATWDGLNYFDGYSFKIFKNDIDDKNTIAGNFISKIKKDGKGRIWILTEDFKVSRYIGNKKFKNYSFKEKPIDISISNNENIIIYTKNNCYEFTEGQFKNRSTNLPNDKNVRLKNILLTKYPNLVINDVLKDKTGNIWYATRKNGLFIIRNKLNKSNKYHIENYLKDPYSLTSFNSNEIETLHEDVFGNIWLGAKDGGISMAYTNSDKILSIAPHPIDTPNIPNETLRAITKDIHGKLWLGYYTKGLYSYNADSKNYKKFAIKEAKEQPDWKRIRTLFTASDGTIWAGTYAGIIRIKKNGDYTLYDATKTANFPNNRNYSIYEDTNKHLWIACWGGVAKFNLNSNKFESYKGQHLLEKYHVRDVSFIDNELILATENNGLRLFDVHKEKLQTIPVKKGLSNFHKEDKSVTSGSNHIKLLDLKNGELQTITTKNGILSNSTYAVYKDLKTGYYWVATLGGLTIFDKEKGIIKNITEKEGLPSQLVYGILTNKNDVWISTTKGIAIINKTNFSVKPFYPKGGWQVSEFSEGAYYQDAKGDLYFGGINGLNYFNPDNIQFNNTEVKLKLWVDYNENYTKNIVKTHNQNHIDIDLIPIRFPIKVEKNIYYKLEGKDKEWILLNLNNKISYSNLVPGKYTFLVKEGKNSNQKLLFNLEIKKPFYQTFLFFIIVIALILMSAVVFIYIKNKAAIRQQKKLEEKIIARTKVIENQKKDLEDINSKLDEKNKKILLQKEKLLELHNQLKNEDFEIEKFKTFVLSEFQEPVSNIIKKASDLSENSENKKSILSQANKLITVISEWNYLSQIKDIGAIKTSVVDLLPIVKNSVNKLENALQQHKVDFSFHINKTPNWVEVDVLRFRLMLQYLFNDIQKYSDKGSQLELQIKYNAGNFNVQIASNSSLLLNSWHRVMHYSPYFKAFQTLIKDLNGEFYNFNLESSFKVSLQIPIPQINTKDAQIETISWKHFNEQDNLASDKKNVLVFCDRENTSAANQIVLENNYNLIFENTASNLNAATKQLTIHSIVLYDVAFSKELLYFLKNSDEIKNRKIPLIYISEDFNTQLREQSVEFGIDTIIQLPASTSFVQKKIASLINTKSNAPLDHKFQQQIFDILTDKEQLQTANDKLLKKSLHIIKSEINNPTFNVEMLVDTLDISRVKCYRLFKERLKQSPSDVIMSLRLQKAEALLKTQKLNISEISFECGYNDPKYFAKAFKKHYGKSPKEFKQQFC